MKGWKSHSRREPMLMSRGEGKDMDIGQVWCRKLCHLWHWPSWAVLFRPPPEWDTNEQERVLEATKHLTVRDGNISVWYLRNGEHSGDCCTGLKRQSHISQWHRGKTEFCYFLVGKKRAFMSTLMCFPPSPTWRQSPASPCQAHQGCAKPCKPLLLPLPQHWVANSVDCGHGQQGQGFTSAELFPCFQEFAFLGHLPVLPSSNTELGLHIFRQGTQTQHLFKLSQRLEAETRSAETGNKPQLCTQHIYEINNSS